MSQRLTMAAAIVMACACVGTLVVVLRMRSDADATALQRERLEALLTESQQTNRELAEQSARSAAAEENLHELVNTLTARLDEVEQTAAEEVSDWNPVEFRLVRGEEDGPPAVGFSVLMRIRTSETGIPSNTGLSDEAGIVRFERVRYGEYEMHITAPWREKCYRRISLQPGESISETVICPVSEPEPLVAELAIEWPEDLARQPIFMKVDPRHPVRIVGRDFWGSSYAMINLQSGLRFGAPLDVWVAPSGVIHCDETSPSGVRFVRSAIKDEGLRAIRWPGADYRVPAVQLYAPCSPEERTRYGNGEAMSGEIRLRELVSIDLDNLTWRVEEGTPSRIVLLPAPEAVAEVREALSLMEAAESETGRQRGRIRRLPKLLMNTDLATVEQ